MGSILSFLSPGEGSWGTDEEGFMSVIMLNSWSQLTATFQAYEDLLGDEAEEKTLLNAIKREFTGNEEMLLTTIGTRFFIL